jgi:Flp pilus assembly pilin Flp
MSPQPSIAAPVTTAPVRRRRRVPRFPRLTRARASRLFRDETGAATAEYAIATMAAVAFASLLVVIMRSDEVRGILTDLVRRALTVE